MDTVKKHDIFISYRRKGGEWFAYTLYMRLQADGYSVFLDKESLKSGDFRETIKKQIYYCKDFVLVLPPEALIPGESSDLFLEEIIFAVEYEKNIIPIMMNGFEFPLPDVYADMKMLDTYEKYIKNIMTLNGCEPHGIMEFDGVLLHLEKSLLYSHSVSIKVSSRGKLLTSSKEICEHYIIGNLASPEFFVEGSRDEELMWLDNAIECTQPVFIWGFGGVGKTELAFEFARQQADKRNVFFVRFQNSIRDTIINMKFTGYQMENIQQLSYEERSVVEEKVYQEKLNLLFQYSENDILIIDNFEIATKTCFEMKQEKAYHDLLGIRMHIIFTTRNKPDDLTPEVKTLNENDLMKIMRTYVHGNVSDDMLLDLIHMVDGHTFTVEIIAKMLADPFCPVSPTVMLEKLNNRAMHELNESDVKSDKDRLYEEKTIYGHIKKLFDITNLDEMETLVLSHAFILPDFGLPLDIFLLGAEQYIQVNRGVNENEYKRKTKSLINKSWIRLDKDNNISLHPLVKEIVDNEIKPAIGMLLEYLDGFVNVSYMLRDKFRFELYETEISNIMSKQELDDFAKSTFEQFLNDEVRIGMLYEHSYYFLDKEYIHLAATAAQMYHSKKTEQSILLSNLVLDDMLNNLKETGKHRPTDFFAYSTLHRLWCPKAEESSWEAGHDDGIYYGNELNEDHSDKPEKVRNIYEKMAEYLRLQYQ